MLLLEKKQQGIFEVEICKTGEVLEVPQADLIAKIQELLN